MTNRTKWAVMLAAAVVAAFVIVTLGRGYWLSFTGAEDELIGYITRNVVSVTVSFALVALGIIGGIVWGVMQVAAAIAKRRAKVAVLVVLGAMYAAPAPGYAAPAPIPEAPQMGLDEDECGGLIGWLAWMFGSRRPRCEEPDHTGVSYDPDSGLCVPHDGGEPWPPPC